MNKKKQQNGLEFELQLMEVGVQILSMGRNDLKDMAMGFVKNVFLLGCAGAEWNVAEVVQQGFDIIKKVAKAISTKLNEKWYLKALVVMTSANLAKQDQCMQNVLKTLELEKDGDWHVIYACLEVILKNIAKQTNTDEILKAVDALSTHGVRKMIDKKDSWRVREKVAELCLCHSGIGDAKVQKSL